MNFTYDRLANVVSNAKFGIRISNLAPAKVNTSMLLSSNLSHDQIIDHEEVAKTVLWIYQQPQSICIRDLVIPPTHYES